VLKNFEKKIKLDIYPIRNSWTHEYASMDA